MDVTLSIQARLLQAQQDKLDRSTVGAFDGIGMLEPKRLKIIKNLDELREISRQIIARNTELEAENASLRQSFEQETNSRTVLSVRLPEEVANLGPWLRRLWISVGLLLLVSVFAFGYLVGFFHVH